MVAVSNGASSISVTLPADRKVRIDVATALLSSNFIGTKGRGDQEARLVDEAEEKHYQPSSRESHHWMSSSTNSVGRSTARKA